MSKQSIDRIEITQKEQLSHHWGDLQKVTYNYLKSDGQWEEQEREVYDRGNGAVVLLINPKAQKIILTEQLRIPTYFNGNKSGMLIEACAGLLDQDDPETAIKREITEETGVVISAVDKIMEAYMTPGSVTELLHFFIGYYTNNDKKHKGGGNPQEGEDIIVLEYHFSEIANLLKYGEIKDAKTIMLLQYALINKLITY